MNQKAKPHKQSLVVGDQNGIRVLGMCRFVSEAFDRNDLTLIVLYYGNISNFDQVTIDTKQTVIFKADEWWFV